MSAERRGVEALVGLFLLIGFCFVAVMVVVFGRVGQGMRDQYAITVEFPNASGLVKGSDVLLAGARIGHVDQAPALIGESFRVRVVLKVRSDVRIPEAANFVVGSSGLLGDRYVDVQLRPNFDPDKTIEPGAMISGTTASGGLDDLTSKGGNVMEQLSGELENISITISRLNNGVLNEANLKNLEETFANLKATTEHFKETSKSLDLLVAKTGTAVDSAKSTMETADAAAGDLRLAIGDMRKMANTATETVKSTQTLIRQATKGQGPLGVLINDRQMAEDLKTLAANLRRSGVLFYRNRPLPTPTPAPGPGPRRRR